MSNVQSKHNLTGNIDRTLNDAMLTSMAECFALQQGIMNIPFYDGKNIPLREFVDDIINGEPSIPSNCEEQYLKAILSRLKGSARDSTHGKTFGTIDELIKHLKQRFSPRKSYTWYLQEISTIRMNRNEDVSEFYDKVTLLTAGAKTALEDKYGTDSAAIMMQPFVDCALESFTRGLPDAMSNIVEARNPETIETAFQHALNFETRHQFHKPDCVDYQYSRSYQQND